MMQRSTSNLNHDDIRISEKFSEENSKMKSEGENKASRKEKSMYELPSEIQDFLKKDTISQELEIEKGSIIHPDPGNSKPKVDDGRSNMALFLHKLLVEHKHNFNEREIKDMITDFHNKQIERQNK